MRIADRTAMINSYKYLTTWSMPLRDTLSFLIPFIGRTDFPTDSCWKEQSWVLFIYVGVFAVLLVPIALILRKDWRLKFLCASGILFLLISYGDNTPLYYFVYKYIPGFQYVRYPVRFLYVTTFAIAMLCGAGFDAYVKGRISGDERMIGFFRKLLVILLASSLAFFLQNAFFDKLLAAAHSFCVARNLTKDSSILLSLLAAIKNIGRFAGFFTVGGVLLFLGLRFKVRQAVVSFAFISLLIIDFVSAAPGSQVMLDTKLIYTPSPNVEYLKKDKSFFRFMISPNTEKKSGFLEGKTYEEAIFNSKDALSSSFPLLFGLYDVGGYDSIGLATFSKLILLVNTSSSPSDTRVLDMLNGKYLIAADKIDARGYKPMRAAATGYLYENTNVMPSALSISF